MKSEKSEFELSSLIIQNSSAFGSNIGMTLKEIIRNHGARGVKSLSNHRVSLLMT